MGSIFYVATAWASVAFTLLVFVGGWPADSKEVLVFTPLMWVFSLYICWAVQGRDKEIRKRREIIEKRRRENGW